VTAKTCHASNMMQDLVEATHIAITKAVWIAMFQLFHYWIGRKLALAIVALSQNMLQDHLTVWSHNNKLAYTTRQQVRWWGRACQLNRTVLSSRRKTVSEGALRTKGGTEFQALAAATGNARSPSDEQRVDGTMRADVLADRRRWRVVQLETGWMVSVDLAS